MYEEGNTVYDINLIEGGIQYSDNYSKTMLFKDLIKVKIVTTDKGPWLPDVFWILITPTATITIENEAPFIQMVLFLLQKLPGFDNDMVIKAMQSSDYAEFVVYEKKT
ncbi:MAG: hypothetical protein EAX96_11110 [Candidatus Lokiarchaeota archaeon]|nr:hypothetical protein [Candidatus Lokiarchaeota archaeon]